MKMCSAKQIFDILPGIWKITRETLTPLKQWQNAGAECIKANGFAAFTSMESDQNVLIYAEKVTINSEDSAMNGMEARQKYKYHYNSADQTLTKYFIDDRLFYTLKVEQQHEHETTTEASASNQITGCGTHLCIQDLYNANYTFANDKQFQLKYTINGPKKCYEIITMYEKCSPEEMTQLGIQISNGDIL